jgi:CheY-like chemotaxis protein
VLIVDDEPEVLQLFSRMLDSHTRPFSILRAEDGLRAMELIHACHPDLVLLDLAIPGLSGFEVLAALKQSPNLAGTKVIVTSAQDPTGEPVVSDHLSVYRSSGFSSKELIEIIGSLAETLLPFLKPGSPTSADSPLG